MEVIRITVEPAGEVVEVRAGESLFQALRRAGVEVPASCGGRGDCGKCRVQILSGDAGTLSGTELDAFTAEETASGIRLACMVYPKTALKIALEEKNVAFDKKDMNLLPKDFKPVPVVEKIPLTLPPASISDQSSACVRMLCELKKRSPRRAEECDVELLCLRSLGDVLEAGAGCVTAVVEGDRILSVESGDTSKECFGITFDMGTTTVVGLLWDLKSGSLRKTSARTNPQTAFGADVISRISYAGDTEGGLGELAFRIRACLEEIKEDLCKGAGISPDRIYRAAVVGNTTMSHLFCGVNPSSLARAPFTPVFCASAPVRAAELGLRLHPAAMVWMMPNIAGHVGSDISGVLMATRLNEMSEPCVAVDIGTNGEILLAANGKVLACSTAAGPAFEGAEIHHGMRASSGAIHKVDIDAENVKLSVIGNERPQGICGSGLIDAVAGLLDVGAINESGKLISRETAVEKKLPNEICCRLSPAGAPKEFELYSEATGGKKPADSVVLTQMDIRKVQLAKAAIAAGIQVLAQEAGIEVGQIQRVFLAGAFGNFVSRESVLRIGLLPFRWRLEQVVPIGNAAGSGASMALLSHEEFQKICALVKQVKHVELSDHPDFQRVFISSMGF